MSVLKTGQTFLWSRKGMKVQRGERLSFPGPPNGSKSSQGNVIRSNKVTEHGKEKEPGSLCEMGGEKVMK
jgi:hypothetical protein